MKYLSECDLLVYDLHNGNPHDVDLALAGNTVTNFGIVYTTTCLQYQKVKQNIDPNFICSIKKI